MQVTYRKKRPIGVTIIAAWHIIPALLLIVFVLGSTVQLIVGDFGPIVYDPYYDNYTIYDLAAFLLLSLFLVIPSAFSLVVGLGLLELRNAARITAIVLHSIGAILNLMVVAGGEPIALLGLGINGIILAYLNRQHVREAFTQGSQLVSASLPSGLSNQYTSERSAAS